MNACATTSAAIPRFLALGDSYTIGEGVAAEGTWPVQLARRLRADGIAIDDPVVIAKTGWSTDELIVAMDTAALAPPYALVTLLIGVNNQYRGRDIDNYREELAMLLRRAHALASTRAQRVTVVSIPDWGVTRFAREQGRDPQRIAVEIDAFNAAARALATRAHIDFVDITEISRKGADRIDMLAADGLHPSTAQYALWTDAITGGAKRALTERAPLRND
jgi:lysophospholipase L1-like esterase